MIATIMKKNMTANHKKKYKFNIAVLLAAYNGIEWIEEQINSISAQKDININIHIFISVDISKDGTLELCKKFEEENNFLTVLSYGDYFGGAAKNFYRLIRDVDFRDFDYVSFSDQDDIWLPNKLSQGISIFQNNDFEAYSSDVVAFWKDGRKKLVKKSYSQKKFDYYFESPGPGCTYILRKNATELLKIFIIKNWNQVKYIESHDWFIYAFFRSRNMPWFIDNKALMLYRQHNSNQIGSNFGFLAYSKRFKMIKNGWYRSEVSKILNVVSLKNNISFNLDRWFLIRNFNQLRRQRKGVFILLLMIILRVF